MSYDLEVRSKPPYGVGVPLEQAASCLLSFPGVVRSGATSFDLDRPDAGLNVAIGLAYVTGADDEESDAAERPERVNVAQFLVPYPFLDKTGPVALEMALRLAERLDWSVHDLQAECEVTRESLPFALRAQQSFGAVAEDVLERAVSEDLSFGELFLHEMWNHRLLPAAGCFVLGAAAAAWLMLELEWSMEGFDKYMPWGIAGGGIALMWLKGLAQATLRYRKLRLRRVSQVDVAK